MGAESGVAKKLGVPGVGARLWDSAGRVGGWNNREDGWVCYAGVFGA